MTVGEMQSKFPSIPWLTYFNSILPEHVQIKNNEVIVVAVPSFIKGLEKLVAETPKRLVYYWDDQHTHITIGMTMLSVTNIDSEVIIRILLDSIFNLLSVFICWKEILMYSHRTFPL
jgi:hypothetical protein